MIHRIDHVSLAVADLSKAKRFFIDLLGGRQLFEGVLDDEGFMWTTLELGKSCLLEIISPVGEEGFLQRFLATRGEGMHHITMQVDDIDEVVDKLEASGVGTFGRMDKPGGWKEVFIHPKSCFGALVQLAEFDPHDWIDPGYVPETYKRFVRPVKGVSVERTADGELLISNNTGEIRIDPSEADELAEKLNGVG